MVGYVSLGLAVLLLLGLAGIGVGPSPAEYLAAVLAGLVACAVAAWALWQARRDRVAYERRLAEQAAASAVTEERLRIARDLHDIVSHGLGTVTMRAAVAGRLGARPDADPADLLQALADVEDTSRATTVELRRMLLALRGEPVLAPAPGLADVASLVDRVRSAGADVRCDVTTRAHSEGAGLTAYRVVAEGLANVARHAGPAAVRVRVHRDGEDLLVSVSDDGPRGGWSPHPGAGQGLRGLSERVGVLGGDLQAGPSGPGWTLTARLPDPGTTPLRDQVSGAAVTAGSVEGSWRGTT